MAEDGVAALALSGTTLYVGGLFSLAGGQPRSSLAAIDTATGRATAWDPQANGGVYALTVWGRTVYAGGEFDYLGEEPHNHLAAIDAVSGKPAT